MRISDEEIAAIRADPVPGLIALLDTTFSMLELETDADWTSDEYEVLLEIYALVVELYELGAIRLPEGYPSIESDGPAQCSELYEFLQSVRDSSASVVSRLKVESLRGRFRAALGADFAYEFSQGDLERVQALVNELRDVISTVPGLEQEHRQRLLRRLEKLQSELHKKVSDLDRFWGLIGDAGVVLGKLGRDAKPIVDRIKEIAEIVWRTQTRAEELPSGTRLPQLEAKWDAACERSSDQ